MDRGYVPLYRRVMDNPLWLSETFTRAQAWIDLLLLANHKNGICFIRGNEVKVNRGQVGWAEKSLAERWKWSRGKVGRFLKMLENEHQIEQQKSKLTTLITIVNYEQYNNNGQQNGQQTGNRQATDGQQTDINKNVKNDKKESIAEKLFDAIWKRYPNKDGKKAAVRHFKASVKTEADWRDINCALDNYLGVLKKEEWRNPKNGSTWFNNWRDWIPQGEVINFSPKQQKDEDEWNAIFSQT